MSLPNSDSAVGLSKLPKARTAEIVVQKVDNELLIFNLKTNQAHHLNKTVALVWQNCDGKTTYAEMAKILGKEIGEKVEADFVWLAINEIEKIDLLDEPPGRDAFADISRRDVLMKYALPAVAIPMVMSLVAPVSAQMGSCIPEEGACNQAINDCCPGLFCLEGVSCELIPVPV